MPLFSLILPVNRHKLHIVLLLKEKINLKAFLREAKVLYRIAFFFWMFIYSRRSVRRLVKGLPAQSLKALLLLHDNRYFIQKSRLHYDKTATWLAQLGERRFAEREVAGSNPGRTNT